MSRQMFDNRPSISWLIYASLKFKLWRNFPFGYEMNRAQIKSTLNIVSLIHLLKVFIKI